MASKSTEQLLTRDQFRIHGFARDEGKCVVCKQAAVDFHHLYERKLWPDGGYYLENGVSVCKDHHLAAEQTVLSPEQLRQLAGITKVILPPHLYRGTVYDKWGNEILENGQRLRGELFDDPSVQKILAEGGQLGCFTKYVKYSRTFHLPFSPKVSKDDRQIADCSQFEGNDVVVHVKLDGENTTWYNDHLHARSFSFDPHPSRDLVKALHAQKAYELPDGFRLCGENVYAQHTIKYSNLETYFYPFSVWNDRNECLSWDETLDWIQLLDLTPCPVIYEGPWDEQLIKNLYQPTWNGDPVEGFVVRNRQKFHYREFRYNVAKYVSATFDIDQSRHWKRKQVVPNQLKGKV